MITFQTIIVYTVLFSCMFILCELATQKNNGGRIWILVALLLYAIVFGVRYGVGVDYMGYLDDFSQLQSTGSTYQYDDTEIGFKAIRSFFAIGGFHYSVYFGFIALLQLSLVFLAFRDNKANYQYLLLSFSLLCVWLSYANGLRQQLAFCFFTYAISFLNKKNSLCWTAVLYIIATLMHKSAYLLVPILVSLIVFKHKDWFTNTNRQLIVLFFAIVLGQTNVFQSVILGLEDYMQYFEILGYDQYFSNKEFSDLLIRKSARNGIGYYIILLIDILLIAYSNKVKSFSQSSFLKSSYKLYYIGVIIHYLFIYSSILHRLNYYFYGFQFIIMAYTLSYFRKSNRQVFWYLVGILILGFLGYLYRMHDNTAAYYFFWQKELFYLNK